MSSDTYIPGTCNIGKGEIRRRQFVALVGTVLSVVALLVSSPPAQLLAQG